MTIFEVNVANPLSRVDSLFFWQHWVLEQGSQLDRHVDDVLLQNQEFRFYILDIGKAILWVLVEKLYYDVDHVV